MFTRFIGVDLHKRFATVSVRDINGREIKRIAKCDDFIKYVRALTPADIVIVESLGSSFYYADEIEKTGAQCVIINPHKFQIISESWINTDKRDAASLSLALWVSMTSNEFGLPTVYKPDPLIRELRRLFSEYQLLNRQIRQYKNIIQAHLADNGIVLSELEKEHLLNPRHGLDVFNTLDLNHTTQICVIMNIYLLWNLFDQKEILKWEIYRAGIPLKQKVQLLLSIKGVSPLLALAFLADVGDITRFKSTRKLNSYLGLVPTVKSSGGKTQMGHINKCSRNLSRSLFTQGIIHFVNSSPELFKFYETVKNRRGACRSHIAVLRKLFSIMRRMPLDNEEYKWKDEIAYHNKLVDYETDLIRMDHFANTG